MSELSMLQAVMVRRRFLADAETPISAYLKLAPEGACYLLESAELAGHAGRYSFLGVGPRLYLRAERGRTCLLLRRRDRLSGTDQWREYPLPDSSPLAALRRLLRQPRVRVFGEDLPQADWPPLLGGAAGYFAYDLVRHLENLPNAPSDPLGLPEAVFVIPDVVIAFDHLRHNITLMAVELRVAAGVAADEETGVEVDEADEMDDGAARLACEARLTRVEECLAGPIPGFVGRMSPSRGRTLPPTDSTTSVADSPDQAAYCRAVSVAKEYIAAGDIFQVVLSQRESRPLTAAPFSIYRALRSLNPSPYLYYLDFGNLQLIGSSPETLVRLENGVIRVRPIAGTRPRGRDVADDGRLAAELAADEKERAEHVMLVDLARNDVGRVALPGTVRVTEFMEIESYSEVMHLVSTVEGRPRPSTDAFDLLAACFPAGTVSGAPKVRAMEIIDELEPVGRGPYAGAVGYFSFTGDMDMAITIRTMVVADGQVHVQAGAGIVADSVPEREWAECRHKARALLRALDWAEAADASWQAERAATGGGG